MEAAPKPVNTPIPHTSHISLAGQARRPNPDPLSIPVKLRGASLPTYPEISVRLANILLYRGYKTLGDLHGFQLSELLRLRNCGKKTVLQLETFVRGIQDDATNSARLQQPAFNKRAGPSVLRIVPSARDLKLLELPLSVLAVAVLNQLGVQRLGDLEGVTTTALSLARNCGKKTFLEIRAVIWRANNGEFDVGPENPLKPSAFDLLSTMDKMLSQLPERRLGCMTLRFGANGQPPCTLRAIATKLAICPDSARQNVCRVLEALLRFAGRRVNAGLNGIAKSCHDSLCPLTPDLLMAWVPNPDMIKSG